MEVKRSRNFWLSDVHAASVLHLPPHLPGDDVVRLQQDVQQQVVLELGVELRATLQQQRLRMNGSITIRTFSSEVSAVSPW